MLMTEGVKYLVFIEFNVFSSFIDYFNTGWSFVFTKALPA